MTSSGPRTPAVTEAPDRAPAVIGPEAIVVWRGERIGVRELPARIARMEDRDARDRLFGAYLEALEALNPRWEDRLESRRSPDLARGTFGLDPGALATELEGFVLHTETPYYAALRRYLALIDIEQGDATVADIWHIARGAAWSHWFGDRDVRHAVGAVGRQLVDAGELTGWLAAEHHLGGDDREGPSPGAAAVGAAYATLIGSPEWVGRELGIAAPDIAPFVDFAAFVRLWRLRRAIGGLQYELRLAGIDDVELARAYYSGIVGHITGVNVPEAMFLLTLGEAEPFASARELAVEILAGDLVAVLEARHGATWWREDDAQALVDAVGATTTIEDALAQLGYDALDWRPVLRQIRTRLIGEMSGYGGPNITTRAGTRKV